MPDPDPDRLRFRLRSNIANAIKTDPSANVDDLRARLRAENLERSITRAMPLTRDQIDRLVSLLLRSTIA